jgi:hypothetical protein
MFAYGPRLPTARAKELCSFKRLVLVPFFHRLISLSLIVAVRDVVGVSAASVCVLVRRFLCYVLSLSLLWEC